MIVNQGTTVDWKAFLRKTRKGKSRFRRSPKEERTCDEIIFDSKAEMRHYEELKLRKLWGEIKDFERQVPLDLAGVIWTVDFMVEGKEGSIWGEEVKGRYKGKFRQQALREFRRNQKQVKRLYGLEVKLFER